jgi:hypothetical protein
VSAVFLTSSAHPAQRVYKPHVRYAEAPEAPMSGTLLNHSFEYSPLETGDVCNTPEEWLTGGIKEYGEGRANWSVNS